MSVLAYEVSWFDKAAGISKKLYFKFFMDDNTIEILDEKSAFLKRIFYPEVTLNDLYLGNSITVHSRVLVIKDFANAATEKIMSEREVHFLTVVTLSDSNKIGQFLSFCSSRKINVGKVRTTSGGFKSFGLEVPANSIVLETVAFYGVDIGLFIESCDKIMPMSLTIALSSTKILEIMGQCGPLNIPQDCSLCLIKPHVLKENTCGELLSKITDSGFTISGALSIHLSEEMAGELLDVYSTIYPSYSKMIDQVCSGLSLALLVTGPGDVVSRFRDLTGPLSPELARVLRPGSIRALYGHDLVHNAVHCTDLSEDGGMECHFVFQTLAGILIK